MPNQILLPGNVFLQPENSVTAVPISISGITLQSATNVATVTFGSAHGYTATTLTNGTTTFAKSSTGHGPSYANLTYFQLTGVTVVALSGVTFAIASIPTTTTMTFYCTLTGTPTLTSATFVPVWVPTAGNYNLVTGANCTVQYNPDNNGAPQVPYGNSSVNFSTQTGATFRTLLAASSAGQIEFDGVGQTIILASGSAGTTRWSNLPR
jgi:hypothetical protein